MSSATSKATETKSEMAQAIVLRVDGDAIHDADMAAWRATIRELRSCTNRKSMSTEAAMVMLREAGHSAPEESMRKMAERGEIRMRLGGSMFLLTDAGGDALALAS
jgi:hypothetical protein